MYAKSIAFILPGVGINPVGGFKIIYEYANRLEKLGYKATIFYTVNMNDKSIIKNIYRFFMYYLLKKYTCKSWFKLNKNIKETLLYYSKNEILKYKNICLSAVTTAYNIRDFNTSSKHNILYLVQDYEKWGTVTDEYLLTSYKFPYKKIVISKWLQKIINDCGENAELIYNGLDFEYFKLITPIEKRDPYSICMLYHLDDRKRSEDAINALYIVKKQFPKLQVNMFGTTKRPSNLPNWFIYSQRPNKEKHNEIYNNSSIFIAASKEEGFGLPPAEAMICGCAVACTNNGGFSTFAKHKETALVSEPLDYEELAKNISILITNYELRITIAKNGNHYIHQFTWEKAVNKFLNLLI